MSLPYFPMYPTDFEAKTSHLTLAEDGAYNRLLRICWMTPGCSIPDDAAWIMRRLRVDQGTFDAVVSVVIDEFFTSEKGRLSNAKLSRIYSETNDAHKKRVSAGSKGGKAKALKTNNSSPSNAKAMLKQPEPEPEPELYKKEDTKVSSQKNRASRLSEDWFIPSEWGEWALSEGWTKDAIRSEADKFKDYWNAKSGKDATKVSWQATWRNWMRNSKTPKGGKETGNGKRSIAERLEARFTEMDSGADRNPSEPLLQADSKRGGGGSGNDGLDQGIVRLFAGGNQRCL